MIKPIVNIAEVELLPRPAGFAATGAAADRYEVCEYPCSGKFGVYAEFPGLADGKPKMFRYLGREAQSIDYWDGE